MKKTVSLILVVLSVVLLLTGCMKPEKKIIGTWNGEATLLGVVAEYSFTFNEDGTGKMSTGMDIGVSMTYTISDTQLDITTSVLGINSTKTYTYAFDKNTLTLNDGSDSIVLTKAD